MPQVTPLTALLVGAASSGEFAAARRLLADSGPLVETDTLLEACEWIAGGPTVALHDNDSAAPHRAGKSADDEAPRGCDLIVVASARPGQHDEEALARLRRAAPLAPVVALLGSWCEGETRTGRPAAGTNRVFWHEFPAAVAVNLAALAAGDCPPWGRATTATPRERLLETPAAPADGRGALLAICTPHFDTAEALGDAAAARGYATAWLAPRCATTVRLPAAILFDADGGEPLLRQLAADFAPAPLLVLADFPRRHVVRQWERAGAAVVLGRPLPLDDLFWHLRRQLAAPREAPRRERAA